VPSATTMIPTITAFMAAHRLADVTVVADAGMISEANIKAIEAARLSFILGARIPDIPYLVAKWRRKHPGEQPPDGLVLPQPRPAGPAEKRGDQVVYYQYSHDGGRRTLRGIDEQVAKAEKAVAGKVPVKRNRFIKLTGADKSVNRDLEAKARALAGWKRLHHQHRQAHPGIRDRRLSPAVPDRVSKSFRMSMHDLAARPIYHHKRASIEAHLTIVFAALAVSKLIEARTGWSISKFVHTAPRYRTVQINAAGRVLAAEDPTPDDLHQALNRIHQPKTWIEPSHP